MKTALSDACRRTRGAVIKLVRTKGLKSLQQQTMPTATQRNKKLHQSILKQVSPNIMDRLNLEFPVCARHGITSNVFYPGNC